MLGGLSWPILMGDADEMPQCIPANPVIPASLGPVDGETGAQCESRFPTSTNREGLGKGTILTRLVSIAAIKAAMDTVGRCFWSESKAKATGIWRAQTTLPKIRQSACRGMKSRGRHPKQGLGQDVSRSFGNEGTRPLQPAWAT